MGKSKVILSHVAFTFLAGSLVHARTNDSVQQDLWGYDRARSNALLAPGASVPREQWESWVSNGDPQRAEFLRSRRMTALQREHAEYSHKNRIRAENISRSLVKVGAPDLVRIRKLPDYEKDLAIDKMCQRLPKGALLHVHPNGTIGPDQALDILRDGNEPVGIKEIVREKDRRLLELGFNSEDMQLAESLMEFDQKPITTWPENAIRILKYFMTLPAGPQEFSRFDTVFPFVKLASKNLMMRHRTFREHALRVQKEGIQYIEYTTSLKVDVKTQSISKTDADLLVGIADHVEATTGVIVRFNLSFLRTEPAAILKLKAEVTRQFLKDNPEYTKYFQGIDLLGPEDQDSALDKGLPVYGVFLEDSLKPGGIKMTQHAGEHGDLRNPRDAMIMGANRLGHANNIWYRKDRTHVTAESLLAMEYARKNKILIETNLASNLRLKAVKSYWEQPWIIMLRLGIPVALSTDNDGILGTSPAEECGIAVRQSNITYAELKDMSFNSIKYSFAPEELKKKLTDDLLCRFKKFENDTEWKREGDQKRSCD